MIENRGPGVAGTTCVFLGLTWLFVSLRCYCRVVLLRRFGPEDYLCILTQTLYTVYNAFVLIGVYHGIGKHYVDIVPVTNIPICLKWWWYGEQFYCLTTGTLKISIGLFLLRISTSRWQKNTVWVVIVISGLISIYSFLLFLLQCQPIAYFWGKYSGGTNGRCINPVIIIRSAYAFSVVHCWSDWTFCILPGFIVWKTKMNLKSKVSVLLLFALGAMTDFLYAVTTVGTLSTIELGIGITVVAATTLRPLVRQFLGHSQLDSSSITISRARTSCPI